MSLSMSGFGMGTMLDNFDMCGVKSSCQHAHASPGGHMSFRCLMFNLSVPYELLFYFVLFPRGPELW